jgi:hypothetical protein
LPLVRGKGEDIESTLADAASPGHRIAEDRERAGIGSRIVEGEPISIRGS